MQRINDNNEKTNARCHVSPDIKINGVAENEQKTLPETFNKSFQEKFGISSLCRGFLRQCDKLNERECTTIPRLLHTNFSVLKDFLKEFRTINDMCQRLKEEAKIGETDSGFDKKTLKFKNNVSCIVYTREPTKVLQE